MDKIEQYYRSHRDEMNVLEPEPSSWNWIEDRLERPQGRKRSLLIYLSAAAFALLALTYFFLPTSEKPPSLALEVGDHL